MPGTTDTVPSAMAAGLMSVPPRYPLPWPPRRDRGSQPLGSQALGSQALGSQALGSQPTGLAALWLAALWLAALWLAALWLAALRSARPTPRRSRRPAESRTSPLPDRQMVSSRGTRGLRPRERLGR